MTHTNTPIHNTHKILKICVFSETTQCLIIIRKLTSRIDYIHSRQNFIQTLKTLRSLIVHNHRIHSLNKLIRVSNIEVIRNWRGKNIIIETSIYPKHIKSMDSSNWNYLLQSVSDIFEAWKSIAVFSLPWRITKTNTYTHTYTHTSGIHSDEILYFQTLDGYSSCC